VLRQDRADDAGDLAQVLIAIVRAALLRREIDFPVLGDVRDFSLCRAIALSKALRAWLASQRSCNVISFSTISMSAPDEQPG
jgi:hypothetical protein